MPKGVKRKVKYNNRKIHVDGLTFDSKREYDRWLDLLRMQENGDIDGLKRQVEYILLPAIKSVTPVQLKTKVKMVERTVQQPIRYYADFVYNQDGKEVVEDVKISPKMIPAEYKIKKKMLRYFYDKEISEYYGEQET
jgi:hypothetical protein